jgi:16S rRNA (guanine966-N2)-methyltransferase
MAVNEVRIIGGKWRGRKLRFPDAPGLRPTLGRVRETLFNWLAPSLQDSHCLDLFAGSGALGFEALSRGAAHVTLVEANRRAAQALRDNAARLRADAAACHIRLLPAARFLRETTTQWDLIFLDPPFAANAVPATLRVIRQNRSLACGGMIYFELPRQAVPEFEGFEAWKAGNAGETRFGLLREIERGPGPPASCG